MRWDDLQVFLALYRGGTIMAAANHLDVSRSTITRRLGALEAAAGVTLVERTPEGLRLSDAGTRLVPIAERVEEDALAAERLFAGRDFTVSGRVDLTVFEVAAALLAPTLVALHAAHPEIELHVSVSNRTLSLRRRESDLAIRATDTPSPDLFGRRLGAVRYGVYGRPEIVEQPNPPWILWDEGLGAEGTWKLARRLGKPLQIAARVDSAHLMMELTRAGAGVALVPVVEAKRYPELRACGPIPRRGTDLGVWLLTHADLRKAARVRTVMRFLIDRVPALLEPPPW